MKIKSLIKHNLMRAAMTLALILACATAWAQTTQSVTYIDAYGQQKTVSATPIVDGYDELELTAGQWYVVSSDDVYRDAPISVNGDGAANIILADGATFTYYGMDAIIDGSLNIYGQSAGTGKFDFDNSESLGTEQSYLITGDLTIYGGKVTLIGHEAVENVSNSQTAVSGNVTIYRGSLYAEGGSHPWRGSDAIDGNVYYYGGNLEARGGSGSDMNGYGIVGNIYLSWSSTSDSFYCNRHNDYSSITIEANKFFVDEENTIHSRTNVGSLDGHILQPLTGWHQNGNVYTISDANGWNAFCEALQDNETYNHFSGDTVKLDADITVTQMAGGSNHAFTGTFDGNHKTLTLNYGTAQAPIDAEFVAPFVEVSGGATFINLNIDGHIYAAYTGSSTPGVGGLIGHLFGGITIEGCTSTVEINSTKDRVGGFVGLCEHAVTFTNCKSSAVVTCTGSGSGFVGWSRDSNYTIAFYGCLFNGKVLKKNGVGSGNGGFIGWKGDSKNVTITNCLVDPAPLGEGETMANGNSATFSREHSDHAATITNCYYTDTLGTAQGTKVYSISKGQYVTTLEINGTATQSYTVSGLSFYSTGIKYGDVLYAAENDEVSLTLSNSSGGDVPAGYQYVYSTNAGTLEGSTLTMPDANVIVSAALRSTGQPVSITYIDADGTIGSHDAIALDGTETMLGEYYKDTWYFVGIDINVNHQVKVYKVHLILCNGKSMNFGTSSSPVNFKCIYYAYSDSAITIYGQTLIDDDAGNLNIYSYHTGFDLPNYYTQNSGNVTISSTYNSDYGINSSAVTLNGGKLIVTSIRASSSSIYINGGKIQATSQLKAANNIKLGWTNPDDYIQVSQYNAIYGNVIVAAGKCFAYTASGETTILGGDNETTLTTDQIAAIAGKRLYPTVPYLDENGETQQCTEFTLLTGNETTLGTSGQETWYVVQGTLNYSHGIQLLGNTHIILCDGAAMNIGTSDNPVSGEPYQENVGFYGDENNLSLYAQSGNTGTLTIYSNRMSFLCQCLTIAGGNVNTTTITTSPVIACNNNLTVRRSALEIHTNGPAAQANDVALSNVTANINSSNNVGFSCSNFAVDNSQLTVNTRAEAIVANNGIITLSNVTANLNSSNGFGLVCSNFTVDNSQLTVTAPNPAIRASVITLGCTAATDFIKATNTSSLNYSYYGTVKIADGQTLYDGANAYTDTLTDAERQTIGGRKLTNVAPPTYDYIDLDGTGATHTAVVIDADNMPTALSGWYIVQGTVSYTNTIDLAGDTHIILADNAVMNVTVTGSNYGIRSVSGNNYSLFVYGQTGQSGELNVTSDRFACYIYGGDITIAGGKVTASGTRGIFAEYYNNNGGNVTIKNATVTATGTSFHGILSENGGNITIDNSNVTATSTGSNVILAQKGGITIDNSNVTATATNNGTVIYAGNGNITIANGTVTASGRIGIFTENGSVTINGGQVTATGNDCGIYTIGSVTINGGQVTATGNNYGIHAESSSDNITLGWTNPTDYIYANKYYAGGTLSIAEGKTFIDENNTFYSGTVAMVSGVYAINGKTLYPNCVVRKQVVGYEEGNGGWVFIASPVAESIAPSEVHNLFPSAGETSNEYDLYRFNQSSSNGKEWQNWKATTTENHPDFTSLVNGQGYLYATKETRTLVFAGEFRATTEPVEVPLDYDATAQLKGWNLVGNPFAVSATLTQPYYRMNAEGSALNTSTENTAVAAMEGVFVQATGNNQTVSFTAQTRGGEKRAVAALNISLSKLIEVKVPEPVEGPTQNNGVSTSSTTLALDNAIIRFDGGQTLEKFSFREGSTKLYIPQDGTDYAIACAESKGEMPVNFKAETDGTYTISVNVDNVEMGYLHLIDNMTGADIDLLAANGGNARHGDARHGDAINRVSTYTFSAKTTDYESRFKLVFAVGSSTGSDTFAFISNGNIIVNGEGTLQIFDAMGRQLFSKELSTFNSQLSTLNYTPGVYVLRLINGEHVRTQKIVVE